MSISDFVFYVLKVPVHIDGFTLICEAIKYAIDNNMSVKYNEYLSVKSHKNYSCVERCMRSAIEKSLEKIDESDFNRIFIEKPNGVKSYIGCAALFYRKEFMNENKEA